MAYARKHTRFICWIKGAIIVYHQVVSREKCRITQIDVAIYAGT